MSYLPSDGFDFPYSPSAATADDAPSHDDTAPGSVSAAQWALDRNATRLRKLKYYSGNILDSGAEGFLRYFFRDPPPEPQALFEPARPHQRGAPWHFQWLGLRTPIPRQYTTDECAVGAVLSDGADPTPEAAAAANGVLYPLSAPAVPGERGWFFGSDAEGHAAGGGRDGGGGGVFGGADTDLPPSGHHHCFYHGHGHSHGQDNGHGADADGTGDGSYASACAPADSRAVDRLKRLLHVLSLQHALFWTGIGVLAFAALFVRIAVGQWPYSGHHAPPMHGDYEAQRHWMEVSRSLPVCDWYRSTAQNDLLYWGLDYPPLSAAWAWLWGWLSDRTVGPQLTAQLISRGHESPLSKMFMRWSVIIADLLVYTPACFHACWAVYRRYGAASRVLVATALLFQPALLIIDHGHFQYNGVSVGLVLWAVSLTLGRRYKTAAVAFTAAFMFKQIALYFALAFFAVMLGAALRITPANAPAQVPVLAPSQSSAKAPASLSTSLIAPAPAVTAAAAARRLSRPRVSLAAVRRVAAIGITVAATLGVILLPFALLVPDEAASPELALDAPRSRADLLSPAPAAVLARSPAAALAGVARVLRRVFPIGRHIFEDKVANFWCVSSVVFRWKDRFPPERLAFFSLVLTLLASLPSCLDLLWRPTSRRFVYALTAIAFAFFLFGFQVHEKSVLFPVTTLTLLLLYHPRLIVAVGSAALFSLFPLLRRDGLTVPYVLLHIVWLMGSKIHSVTQYRVPALFSTALITPVSARVRAWIGRPPLAPQTSLPVAVGLGGGGEDDRASAREDLPPWLAEALKLLLLAVHAYDYFAAPNERYPFIKELLFATAGCAVFAGTFIYLIYFQLMVLPTHSRTFVETKSGPFEAQPAPETEASAGAVVGTAPLRGASTAERKKK